MERVESSAGRYGVGCEVCQFNCKPALWDVESYERHSFELAVPVALLSSISMFAYQSHWKLLVRWHLEFAKSSFFALLICVSNSQFAHIHVRPSLCRYLLPKRSVAATISKDALDVSFWLQSSDLLQLGGSFIFNKRTSKAVGSLTYQLEMKDAIIKGMIDSDWSVGCTYNRWEGEEDIPISLML